MAAITTLTGTGYLFPLQSGNSGKFLTTDGSILSWNTIGGGGGVTGSGASGQVAYWNGTTSQTGTNNLFWDAANNRLGVGLINPQRVLEIFSSTPDNHLRLSGAAPSVSLGESVLSSIYQAKFGLATVNGHYATGSVAGDFVILSQTGATLFMTSATEKMRLTTSGNLVINSISDNGQKLQVNGDVVIAGTFTISASTGLPVQTAANLRLASGFSSPDIGRMFIGDGTGWKFHMSKRISSTTTDLITFFDNGSIQTTAPTGYTAKPWKLGDATSGTLTPDYYIKVEIDGQIYSIPALLGTP